VSPGGDGIQHGPQSTGGGGLIADGASQWMMAGAGILHDEMPTEELVMKGGLFHGVQLRVHLPQTLRSGEAIGRRSLAWIRWPHRR
jgi:redox-sensitive bicupin YhaK (pirin superfamily)